MKRSIFILGLICVFSSCKNEITSESKAKEIIKKAVEKHGGENYENFDVSFDFRAFKVRLKQDNENYRFERVTEDSTKNQIKDILTNSSFERQVNGEKIVLSEKDFSKYKEGINSIAYFVLLPYKLLDAAVISEYIGNEVLEGKKYDKISVKFKKEGGGKDHDDVFCYWFDSQTNTMDYLAYDNGGPRFRKAVNRKKVGGIIFQDYENYEILDKNIPTTEYDKAFKNGKAKLLSKIEQTNYLDNK